MKDWTGNKAHGSWVPKKASSKGGSTPTTKPANKQY